MKRILVLLTSLVALAATSSPSAAQIVIDESDIRARLQEGTFAMQAFFDFYAPAPFGSDTPADSLALAQDVQAVVDAVGAGGVYDLSGFAFQPFVSFVGDIQPLPVESSVPGADTFNGSGAEYVVMDLNSVTQEVTYTYVGVQSDGLYEYGSVVEGETPEVQSPPQLQQRLPLEMGTTWSRVDSTELFGFVEIDSTYNEVVGYGELQTPSGSAPALVVREQTYNFSPGGGFIDPDTTRSEMYTFYTESLWLSASLTAASEGAAPSVFYAAESSGSAVAEVGSGQSGVGVTTPAASVELTSASTSAGRVLLFHFQGTPAESTLSGSATSGDGTTVTPTALVGGGYVQVRAEGLTDFTYRVCLDYGDRSDIADPGRLVIVTRASTADDWTPLATTLDEAGEQVCASGLDASAFFALASDGSIGTAAEDAAGRPTEFVLLGNTPNPFSQRTTVRYELPEAGHVRLDVYDALGRHVRTLVDARQEAGRQQVRVERGQLTAGVYVVRLTAGGVQTTSKMVLAR